jgi:hypothetical protein
MGRNDSDQSPGKPSHEESQAPLVKKVSGSDLDQAISRLSKATAPYFRSGGVLMPDEQQ